MNSKLLHKHALPVLVLCVGLFVFSIMAFDRFMSIGANNNSLTQLSNARLFTITPTTNGLFHISRYQSPTSQATARIPSAGQPTIGLGGLTDAGRVAELKVMISGSEQLSN